MKCAMRHAMMLISNGGGVDQIYNTMPLPQYSTRGSCPATPTLDYSAFTTGTLTIGITSLVKGLQLFSPGSAVTNIGHCKVVDPIAARRRRNPATPLALAAGIGHAGRRHQYDLRAVCDLECSGSCGFPDIPTMGLFIITIHSLYIQRPTLFAAAPSGPRKALFTSVPCGYCRLHLFPQEIDFRRRKAWQI